MRIFGLGPTELAIILVIVLVLFGPKQIPKLSRMFGKAMKDLREGMEGKDEKDEESGDQTAIPAAKTETSSEEAKKTEDSAV
jgi:sec-independent protein translocase protein TatA